MLGTLLFHGQDLDNLLDNYTFEQWEAMASAVWRHSTTVLNVIAYAIGGDEAEDRASKAQGKGRAVRRPGERAPTRAELDRWGSTPWRLESPPTHTPEEEEEIKRRALRSLERLGGLAREAYGNRMPRRPAVVQEDPAVADALASLDAFEARTGQGEGGGGARPPGPRGRKRRG